MVEQDVLNLSIIIQERNQRLIKHLGKYVFLVEPLGLQLYVLIYILFLVISRKVLEDEVPTYKCTRILNGGPISHLIVYIVMLPNPN